MAINVKTHNRKGHEAEAIGQPIKWRCQIRQKVLMTVQKKKKRSKGRTQLPKCKDINMWHTHFADRSQPRAGAKTIAEEPQAQTT